MADHVEPTSAAAQQHTVWGCNCALCTEWRQNLYNSGRWPRPRFCNGETHDRRTEPTVGQAVVITNRGYGTIEFSRKLLVEADVMAPDDAPNFDKLAYDLQTIATDPLSASPREVIREGLRRLWNARGAADAKAVEDRLSTLTGWVTSEPYRNHLRDAIKDNDR